MIIREFLEMVTASTSENDKERDLILDIQFDHFGTRFATASADQSIRVRAPTFVIKYFLISLLH